jgi:hypothetical protein
MVMFGRSLVRCGAAAVMVVALAARAEAQAAPVPLPVPETETETETGTETGTESGTEAETETETGTGTESESATGTGTESESATATESEAATATESEAAAETAAAAESDLPMGIAARARYVPPPLELPEVLAAPSGRLLSAGVVYSRSGLDTSGGVASDLRVGLGDVAEFGVAITDQVRARRDRADRPDRIDPYVTAMFDMGIAEDRLFRHQPALVLGFRKSFEAEHDGHRSRIAALHLSASKRLGSRAELHLGGVFWDATLRDDDGAVMADLHERGVRHQLRPFGGIGLRPLDDAEILVDLFWHPEICYGCTAAPVSLRPLLSWGVRYHVADWLKLDSGVRVPDIGDANLLDAQIFGTFTVLNWRLHRAVR